MKIAIEKGNKDAEGYLKKLNRNKGIVIPNTGTPALNKGVSASNTTVIPMMVPNTAPVAIKNNVANNTPAPALKNGMVITRPAESLPNNVMETPNTVAPVLSKGTGVPNTAVTPMMAQRQ